MRSKWSHGRHASGSAVLVAVVPFLVVCFAGKLGIGMPRYNSGCHKCHGAFTDGTSQTGSAYPNDDKHRMHRGSSHMNTECGLCHTSGDQDDPDIAGPVCEPPCVNGECTGPNTCTCETGWQGPTCADPVCEPPCVNGECIAPDTCLCEAGWQGPTCAEPCEECGCPADLDGSGSVRVPDLVILLGAWGDNPGHPADLDHDGEVRVPDLVILLAQWGPCSECQTPADCDDGELCTDELCTDGICSNPPLLDGTSCDDGDHCTTGESCQEGTCVGGEAISCDDTDECTDDDCDPSSGCVHDAIECGDGNACTLDDCDSVTGCTHEAIDCHDDDACTDDDCDAATGCVHNATDCEDGNACTLDGCDAATGCTHDAIDCNDDNACTDDSCDSVSGCLHDSVDCEDGDLCTVETCDSLLGCLHEPMDCDDGDPCTGDECTDGECVHTPIGCAVQISEIRINQPGPDFDEYFELTGPADTALDGLTYLVIGDNGSGNPANSGVIEEAVDLGGNSVGAGGFFVVAQEFFTLGMADLVAPLNFEDSDNVTHLLVSGFSGSIGDDLDVDDDGSLDVTPWDDILDLIALVEENNPPTVTEFHYGPPSIGPDGVLVPYHVYRCATAGVWTIGALDPIEGTDTPGQGNSNCE